MENLKNTLLKAFDTIEKAERQLEQKRVENHNKKEGDNLPHFQDLMKRLLNSLENLNYESIELINEAIPYIIDITSPEVGGKLKDLISKFDVKEIIAMLNPIAKQIGVL